MVRNLASEYGVDKSAELSPRGATWSAFCEVVPNLGQVAVIV